MNKICTTIEQSKKLLELRLDPNTADMCYHFPEINGLPICVSWKDVAENEKTSSLPAWSVEALARLLPKLLVVNGITYQLAICPNSNNGWMIYYDEGSYGILDAVDGEQFIVGRSSLVDMFFDALIKLKDNNFR